jgi:hypothetical protein
MLRRPPRTLASIKTIALTRILLDMGMYVSLMVFVAGFRYLIIKSQADYEWAGTLALVAGAVWWAVSLVADGLEGGAVLDAVSGRVDPSAVRALVEGALLIYNGAIAFAVTGLFMAAAGYAILGTRALPSWTGWLALVSTAFCVLAIPSMYIGMVDHTGFYNAAGVGACHRSERSAARVVPRGGHLHGATPMSRLSRDLAPTDHMRRNTLATAPAFSIAGWWQGCAHPYTRCSETTGASSCHPSCARSSSPCVRAWLSSLAAAH